MNFTFDEEADAAYLTLDEAADAVDHTEVLELPEGALNVDVTADGKIIGFEFLPAGTLLGSATVGALLAKFSS